MGIGKDSANFARTTLQNIVGTILTIFVFIAMVFACYEGELLLQFQDLALILYFVASIAVCLGVATLFGKYLKTVVFKVRE